MTDWPAGPPLDVDTAPRVGVDGIDGSGDANSDFCATLAMASHELRQPLQVIVGAHHVLAESSTAAPRRHSWPGSRMPRGNWPTKPTAEQTWTL